LESLQLLSEAPPCRAHPDRWRRAQTRDASLRPYYLLCRGSGRRGCHSDNSTSGASTAVRRPMRFISPNE